MVDSMADFCLVYLPAEDNFLRAASIAYRDRIRGVVLADLRESHSVPVRRPADRPGRSHHGHQPAGAGRGGPAAGRNDIPAPLASLLDQLRPDNVLVAPLATGPRPAGVLALGRGPEQPFHRD